MLFFIENNFISENFNNPVHNPDNKNEVVFNLDSTAQNRLVTR